MPDTDGPSLPETIVKEAVGAGLDSPMRETILDAVDEAEGGRRMSPLPLVGGALAIGAGIGYLLASRDIDETTVDTESIPVDDPKEIIEGTEADGETDDGGTSMGGRLPKIALLLAIGGAAAYLKRRLGGDGEGWEPIEEVETSVGEEVPSVVEDVTGDDESAGERLAESEDAAADEAESTEETGEETEAGDEDESEE